MKMFLRFIVSFLIFAFFQDATAQRQASADTLDLMALSLEELMHVKIFSASKSEESLFEAPVSSFVIMQKDILSSGATSIPEALRLAPAIIVREMANGSYDVSIRAGRDNLPSHQWWNMNSSILAMINSRPIFNYYSGGTYWQNLPVDLSDVERIEIVYGPNAPLYGPNAVDGVVNIITRKGEPGTYGSASIQSGQSLLFSALGGKEISDKVEVNISVNHSNRKRMSTEYYDPAIQSFVSDLRQHSDTVLAADPNLLYPHPGVGSRRTGLNFNLYYKPGRRTTVSVNSAYNESYGLIGSTTGAIFQALSNNSLSHLVRIEKGGFTAQTSIVRGRIGNFGNVSEYNYDYTTWDNYIDYNWKLNRNLSLRPSVSFQDAVIDDEPYTVDVSRQGLFNNKASMYNYAFSLKADYMPSKSFRFVGAVRADKFKAPDDMYISYQGIINYKITKKNIVRFLAGRSFMGSFIDRTYMDWTFRDDPYFKLRVIGSEELSLLQNDILEIGYKGQIEKNFSFDVSIFSQRYSKFASPVIRVVQEFSPMPWQQAEWHVLFENIDLRSHQVGATFSATVLFGPMKFTPSITWQKTELTNYSPYHSAPHPVYAPENNTENVSNRESEYAPNLFGGFALDMPISKWNFNVSGYFYQQYKQDGLNSLGRGGITSPDIENIKGKLLLNANVGYDISPDLKASLNARNLLGQDARESYGTDRIGTMVFAGINVQF